MTLNKRMQAVQPTRYVRDLAADAGRYKTGTIE